MNEFFSYFRNNIKGISAYTMLNNIQEIDEDMLDSNICWMVTDNVVQLLAKNVEHGIEFNGHREGAMSFIGDELRRNRLIIIGQDLNSDADHWFSVVGDFEYCHIVEYLEDTCINNQTYTTIGALNLLYNIMEGYLPDRFYGQQRKHNYNLIMSYERLKLDEVKTSFHRKVVKYAEKLIDNNNMDDLRSLTKYYDKINKDYLRKYANNKGITIK